MQSTENEIWRPIPIEKLSEYDASSLGRIRRMRGVNRPDLNGTVLKYNTSLNLKNSTYFYDELIVTTFFSNYILSDYR